MLVTNQKSIIMDPGSIPYDTVPYAAEDGICSWLTSRIAANPKSESLNWPCTMMTFEGLISW
jgi:hypothetical protein